jgi:hypothetical protein
MHDIRIQNKNHLFKNKTDEIIQSKKPLKRKKHLNYEIKELNTKLKKSKIKDFRDHKNYISDDPSDKKDIKESFGFNMNEVVFNIFPDEQTSTNIRKA